MESEEEGNFVPLNTAGLLCVIAFVCTLIWLINFHWKRRHLYRMAAKIPGPAGYPIVGVALNFIGKCENLLIITQNMFNANPDIFKFWLGPLLGIGLSDPAHLQVIMTHPQCLGKGSAYDFMKPVLGNGLISAPEHIWRKNRKLINPAFHQKLLNSFVPIFNEQAKILVKIVEENLNNPNLDIFEKIFSFSMDSLCESTMGIKVNTLTTQNRYGHALDRLTHILAKRIITVWYHIEFLFSLSKYKREFDESVKEVKNFTHNVVVERREMFENKRKAVETGDEIEDDIQRNSFLDHLLQLRHVDERFTDEELSNEVDTFMAAGSDTTAVALSFALVTLGMHPHIQEKVYEEVLEVLGTDRDVTVADLPKLVYTEMFLKENLRIFPPVPFILKSNSADIEIDGLTLPAHCTLYLNIVRAHINPKYWKDPLKFDPNRFLPEEVAKRHPFAFVPFSGGPRNCIGYKYFFMTMKVFLATVLRKFVVRTEYKSIEEIALFNAITLKPKEGFKVTFELRD